MEQKKINMRQPRYMNRNKRIEREVGDGEKKEAAAETRRRDTNR